MSTTLLKMYIARQEVNSAFCVSHTVALDVFAWIRADAPMLNYDVLTGDGGGRNTLPSDTPERSRSTGFECNFAIDSFVLREAR